MSRANLIDSEREARLPPHTAARNHNVAPFNILVLPFIADASEPIVTSCKDQPAAKTMLQHPRQ